MLAESGESGLGRRSPKIASVGAAADPVTADPRALEVGGDRYWIIPGLVNAHSHGRGLGWFRLGTPDDALEPSTRSIRTCG
jgi:5-methylthioadenosine/S-adenosylhomocysteine deaminase